MWNKVLDWVIIPVGYVFYLGCLIMVISTTSAFGERPRMHKCRPSNSDFEEKNNE